MSSVLAHITAGASVFACSNTKDAHLSRPLLAACVLLATLPDMDYFLWWIFQVNLQPRMTHSLAFSLASAAAAWFCLRALASRPSFKTLISLAVAASSHLLLDFLVGVHPLPLLWPLANTGFIASPGVLPSAGRLRLLNPYLWRNLFIEAGILIPVFGAAICFYRRGSLPLPPLALRIGILAIWVLFVAWSISLSR